MKTIVTHPDNLESIMRALNAGKFDAGRTFACYTVKTDPHIERDKPTGRYWLPASINVSFPVEREDVRIETPFISYGPEDIPFLLFSGMIREDREMLFYVFDESIFRMRFDMPIQMPPRFITCDY